MKVRIPRIFTGKSQNQGMERKTMEWSDDAIITTIMDTKAGVDRIEEKVEDIKECTVDHEARIRNLELRKPVPPDERNWKTVTKKYGPFGGALVMLVYIIWDVYMKIRTGGG